MILSWDKPKKTRSSAEHAEMYSADGAPDGAFVPNMSSDDVKKWKATLAGKTTGFPQVEIRRNGLLVIVSLRGYKYKHYDSRQNQNPVIHIASSGPQMFTMREFEEFNQAVKEAEEFLKAMQ